ncbi:long-chain fatty acid--CoA ligase [Actinoalloteichus sp. AHMU CJ021]|uniref:AMP-dependent synthetase/ligase n=1 Tax=Actinoalloteichus sp. AHMU CJ021 TaxID=2072503 RepID=UPI000CA06C4E|nr:long-chain fatty acid--CoA ligase [Actinoalloteichus sp. AHMU CJ021]
MREFTVPASSTVQEEENLTDVVWANADRFAGAVSLRRRVRGAWVDVTAAEFAAEVLAAARGLVATGIQPGDRVALMSRTRYEWTLFDFAVWAAGGVVVPVYETSSPEQIRWILSDSGARLVVVESDDHLDRLEEVRADLPQLVSVWRFDDPAAAGDAPAPPSPTAAVGVDGLVTALVDGGGAVPEAEVHARARAVRADDPATVIYTSGTTGRPKGAVLSHRNLLAQARAEMACAPELLRPGNSLLMFLPLAHVLARATSIAAIHSRTTLGHSPDTRDLMSDLRTFRPTVMVGVPRVFEKIYQGARERARAAGRTRIFDLAAETAVAHSRARDRAGVPLGLRLRHAVFDRLVYRRLRAAPGGRCLAAISGGAPLNERLVHFFRGVGLPVLEGYGLTETSAAASVNTFGATRVGSVGRPLPGTTIRVDDSGEILVRGEIVAERYWNDPEATRTAFGDGWFHTGDLGELDQDGFLRITDRKKDIIVTAAGKNVAPAVLEDRLRAHPLIAEALVVGEGRPFVGALLTLDVEALRAWCEEHGVAGEDRAGLITDPKVRAEVGRAVDEANRAVSAAESVKKFTLLDVDFSEAGGELTPSLKVRRAVVAERYAAEIEELYRR